jgi:hypothetical protein
MVPRFVVVSLLLVVAAAGCAGGDGAGPATIPCLDGPVTLVPRLSVIRVR